MDAVGPVGDNRSRAARPQGADGIFDERLERLMGRGAGPLCAALEQFSEPVGTVWAVRDAAGEVVDFVFGYGNPAIARMLAVDRREVVGRQIVTHMAEGVRQARTLIDGVLQVARVGRPGTRPTRSTAGASSPTCATCSTRGCARAT